jgi:HPt (histidine-containing phosphotransfer) domain-containing protein
MDAPLDTSTLQALRLVPGPQGRPLLDQVVRLALEQMPTTLAKLEEALVAGEWETLRRTAHTLKGTSGSFGAKRLSEHAKALEFAAQDPGAPQAEICMNAVRAETTRVLDALRELQSS